MRNKFLLSAIFCLISINLQAQSDSLLRNSDLERIQSKLAINVSNENGQSTIVLKNDQLRMLLSNEQFQNYEIAHNRYVTSIPLLAIGVCDLTLSTMFLVRGFSRSTFAEYQTTIDLGSFIISGLFLIKSLPFLITGTILRNSGVKTLNNIAKDYNQYRQTSHFQNGLQLNFGLVGNGIGMQVQF
jgi:hypothetical protein